MLFPEENFGENTSENFSDIIGHSVTKNTLNKFIKSGNIPSSLIFSGKEGIGKYLISKEFIRLINKSNDNNYDLKIIEPNEKNIINVDAIREIGNFFSLSSSFGKYRSVIIRDADKMNINACNSLLKILEEPSNRCILILIYDDYNAVLDTIKSRCMNIAFQNLKFNEFSEILKNLGYESDNEIFINSTSSISRTIKLLERDYVSISKELISSKNQNNNQIKKLSDYLKENKDDINIFLDSLFSEIRKQNNVNLYNEMINLALKFKDKNLDIYDILKSIKYILYRYS